MTTSSTIGDRLREVMAARGLSQADLSRLANIDRSNLNRIINNHRPARTNDLRQIAEALGIPLAGLISGIELPGGVVKSMSHLIEIEASAFADRQRAERLQAELLALEKATAVQWSSNVLSVVDLVEKHKQQLSALRTELLVARTELDELTLVHHTALAQAEAERQQLRTFLAQRDMAIAILEAQNQGLQKLAARDTFTAA